MNKTHRHSAVIALLTLVFVFACTRIPEALGPVNVDENGVALKGYDPVAYFTDNKPVEGSPEFEYVWKSAKWRFASAEHRDMFAATPGKYAPQFGGY